MSRWRLPENKSFFASFFQKKASSFFEEKEAKRRLFLRQLHETGSHING
jgi:hypothetical protein